MKRIWIASIAGAAMVTMSFLLGQAVAGGKGDGVKKIVELIKKGDNAGAKKAAQDYAKANTDLDDLMHLMKPVAKGGMQILDYKNGIEQMLIKVGRDTPTATEMTKNAAVFAEMAPTLSAIALITEASSKTQKFGGKKTEKDWNDWARAMSDGGVKLGEAAKAKSSADIKTAASKINAACASCHSTFK